MKSLLFTFTLFLHCVVADETMRDPFWPIGYTPSDSSSTAQETTPENQDEEIDPNQPRVLTDEELREQARQEAARITKSLRQGSTNAIAVMGGKTFAYVGSDILVSPKKWVTQGDHFIVEILGQKYRMDVVKLTRQQIQLEPRRL